MLSPAILLLLCGCVGKFHEHKYHDWDELKKAVNFPKLKKGKAPFKTSSALISLRKVFDIKCKAPNYLDYVVIGKRVILLLPDGLEIWDIRATGIDKHRNNFKHSASKIGVFGDKIILYGSREVMIFNKKINRDPLVPLKILKFNHNVDFICDYKDSFVCITTNGTCYRYDPEYQLLWESVATNAYQQSIRSVTYNSTQICLLNHNFMLYQIGADNGFIENVSGLSKENENATVLFYGADLLASSRDTVVAITNNKRHTCQVDGEPKLIRLGEGLKREFVGISTGKSLLVTSPQSLSEGIYFTELPSAKEMRIVSNALIMVNDNQVKIYNINGDLVSTMEKDHVICMDNCILIIKDDMVSMYITFNPA